MRITQTNICNGNTLLKENTSPEFQEHEKVVFMPESQITIDGKVYLIQRHFVSARYFKDAIFAVVKNDAKKVLVEVSKIKTNC